MHDLVHDGPSRIQAQVPCAAARALIKETPEFGFELTNELKARNADSELIRERALAAAEADSQSFTSSPAGMKCCPSNSKQQIPLKRIGLA